MADGASAIIGILAFGLHVVHKVYEIIEAIKDAPDDILALRQDATEIGCFLLHLQQSDVWDSAVIPQIIDSASLISRIKDDLDEIELFVDKVTEQRRDGKVRVRKIKWLLRNGRCEKLRGSLASFKSSIIAIVTASTSQSLTRLMETQKQCCNNVDALRAFLTDHKSWLARQIAEIASFRAAVEQQLAVIAHSQDKIFFMLSSTNVSRPLSNPCSLSSQQVSVSGVGSCGGCASSIGNHPQQSRSSRAERAPDTARDHLSQCEEPCQCCCHDKIRLTRASPRCLSPFFGNLFLPRSVFRRSLTNCNMQTCRQKQRHQQIAKVKYFFPSWFIAVDMKLRMGSFPVHFCLQTPRRVPQTSPVFCCIVRADIPAVRSLFLSNQASVNDIDEGGWGVLHYAAVGLVSNPCEKVARMFQFLTDVGAHTEWEDGDFQRTALQYIKYRFNQRPHAYGCNTVNSLSIQLYIAGPVFHEDASDAWEDWMEKSDLPHIHRAVLTDKNRETALKDTLAGIAETEINTPCRQGLTALEWAINMFLPDVVRTLLECGADVHKGIPLHGAAYHGNDEVIKLLIHAGADVNLQDHHGRTPLHRASFRGQASAVEELIRLGGENLLWDIQDNYGRTVFDEAERGRTFFAAIGWPTGHARIIQTLSPFQVCRFEAYSGEPGCEDAHDADLEIPGRFPEG